MSTDLTPADIRAMADAAARDYARAPEFRSLMLDAQRSLFKPRVLTTQAELTKLTETATDGDEVYALSEPLGMGLWRFRYFASSGSAHRWYLVGGPPMRSAVTATESNGATLAWMNLATDGPAISVPFNGDYMVLVQAHQTAGAAVSNMAFGAVVGDNTPANANWSEIQLAATEMATTTAERRFDGLTAGDSLKIRYVSGTANCNWSRRNVSFYPIRVG